MRMIRLTALLLFAATVTSGCHSVVGVGAKAGLAASDAPRYAPVDDFGSDSISPAANKQSETRVTQNQRLRIFRAEMGIEVPHADSAIERLLERVAELNGYLAQRVDNQVTIRVPAESFEALVDEIRQSGRVLAQRLSTQDVTKQYRDTSIRLENAEKSRKRLLALLDNAEIAEILKIEEQLQRLTLEIENLKATLLALDNQIALSTITVSYRGVSTKSTRIKPSRFWWINQLGARSLLHSF